MREIIKQAKAREDLKGIWYYTREHWDVAQADKYLRELNTGIARLAANPDVGRPREDVCAGYRSLSINQHIVYYTLAPDAVRIVRVLHSRMDVPRHL